MVEAPASPLGLPLSKAACALAAAAALALLYSLRPRAATAILAASHSSADLAAFDHLIPSACAWNPFQLPMDAQRFAIDLVRLEVPSKVRDNRRHLSVQLAMGALLGGIPGDFVETGVYRGGTAILLLKTLEKYDPRATRKLWAADSFQGLPDPVDQDMGGDMHTGEAGTYSAAREVFEGNVRRHGISRLDARMEVLQGWFNETLPGAPIPQISFLRLDGDLYVSTMDALEALYDKVSPGGLIYVDDYNSFNGCKRAVDEFRQKHGITAPLMLQALPERGFARAGEASTWEAAWWIKC